MDGPDAGSVRRRLEVLAPLFEDMGTRTRETYAKAGIFEVLADSTFPVSDAAFTRRGDRYVYHPHGPIYFTVTRLGKLELAGPGAGVPLTEALTPYVQLVGKGEVKDPRTVEGATEWFPPPRLLLLSDTSELYIAQAATAKHMLVGAGFLPLGQFVDEKAQLFVEAFRSAR
jgi:hypothetical protein